MALIAVSTIKTTCVLVHLLGLSLGVGGALILDLLIFRYFYCEKITNEKLAIFQFMARIVSIGLAVLWITGLMFLFLYYLYEPNLLENQKVWAKIIIVFILTINGFLLHKKIFPILKRNIGKHIFYKVTVNEKAMMFSFASISLISWIFPIFLGVAKSLNFAVQIVNVLSLYFLVLSWTCLLMCLVYKLFISKRFRLTLTEPL